MRTAMAEEGWSGKGDPSRQPQIIEEPADERRDLVAPNALAFARRIGVAVLTTTQLHEALRQRQESRFDESSFWDSIFAADGLVAGLSESQRSKS